MVKVDDVLKTIDNNENLSLEIKENFKDLLTVYTNNVSNVDLETINTKIANLKIEASDNKYIIKEPVKYVDLDNAIYVNLSEANKDYDYRYLLMRELMLLQTYKDDISKQRNNDLGPIYEGYASICANVLVGNDSSINLYEDEMITVNILAQIVDEKSIEELFINNNSNLLFDNLAKSGTNINDFKSLIDLMNYNIAARDNERGQSMLSTIQLKLINMFANKSDKTIEDVENFKNYLYGNSAVFENNAVKYNDINKIYETFEKVASNLELEHQSFKIR